MHFLQDVIQEGIEIIYSDSCMAIITKNFSTCRFALKISDSTPYYSNALKKKLFSFYR